MRHRRSISDVLNPILIATMCACLAVAQPSTVYGGPYEDCLDAAAAAYAHDSSACDEDYVEAITAHNAALYDLLLAYMDADAAYSDGIDACFAVYDTTMVQIADDEAEAVAAALGSFLACGLLCGETFGAACIGCAVSLAIATGIAADEAAEDREAANAALQECEAPVAAAFAAAGDAYNAATDDENWAFAQESEAHDRCCDAAATAYADARQACEALNDEGGGGE